MSTKVHGQPQFAGSIPENYHRNLGPILFESYAKDIAARLERAGLPAAPKVLELACGTGIVTRRLLEVLPAGARLTATDLSEPMLGFARSVLPTDPRLTLAQADACALPFPDQEFDAVVCQYGVMFFPDKVQAMRGARRVLRAGGTLLFSVWDSLEENSIAGEVQAELERRFPQNPPMFLRTPYGWSDRAEIERTVRAGGFTRVRLESVPMPCEVASAEAAARAVLVGTPLALDLADRNADVQSLVARVTALLAERYGRSPCRGTMKAIVVQAR